MSKKLLVEGLIVGLTGAVSVLITEAIVTRVDLVARCRIRRGVSRMALGAGGALGVSELGASDAVAYGVIAGPTMWTAVDAMLSAIPRRRLDPPAVTVTARLGEPWPPQV